MTALLGAIVFCLILAAAAAWDVTSYRIPNLLCLALALTAFVFALPHGGAEWLSRGASVSVVSLAVLILYVLRTMGGGDVKLLASASLWMPLATLPTFLLALAITGGVQAAVTLALRRRPAPATERGSGAATPHRRMPYGLSIAAAGLWWAWTSHLGWPAHAG